MYISDKQLTKFHVEIEDDNEILTNTENNPDVVSTLNKAYYFQLS
jgi:hypothetical protein